MSSDDAPREELRRGGATLEASALVGALCPAPGTHGSVFVQRFDANRTHRLEKLDARTGASAWDADVTLGLYLPLSVALNVRVGASRVYLAREYQVDVLDLATGRTLGRLPPGGRWALQKPRRTWKVG